MVYICTKFHESILDGISYRADTIFIRKNSKRHNSIENVGKEQLRFFFFSAHCLMMVYICTKFHENIHNGIKAIEWTRFS